MLWEYVINCAGGSSRRNPDYEENVTRTMRLLNEYPAEHWIQISSIVAERDEPYGWQKRVCEEGVLSGDPHALIVRLGALVGRGQTKGPFYDMQHGRLYIHPDSTLPAIDVDDAARLVWESRDMEGVLNVAGKGSVRVGNMILADYGLDRTTANHLLRRDLSRLPIDSWDIDISRLETRCEVPSSVKTVRRYFTS